MPHNEDNKKTHVSLLIILCVEIILPLSHIGWASSSEKVLLNTLRKHAYSNTLKILPAKIETFQIKNSYILHISDQIIDCGTR